MTEALGDDPRTLHPLQAELIAAAGANLLLVALLLPDPKHVVDQKAGAILGLLGGEIIRANA
ncbi:MAG: hypothetical protein M3071_10380 [Actinomycetota bacterium]|nr:hypothetical protein [Actinomycetota bacterium]